MEVLVLFHAWTFLFFSALFSLYIMGKKKNFEIPMVDMFALAVSSVTYFGIYLREEEFIRWTGYTFACSLFAYASARALGREMTRSVTAGFFMGITLATGAMVYFVEGTGPKGALFGIGSVTYILSLVYIVMPHGKTKWDMWKWLYFVFFVVVWSIYPVVYWLSPVFGDIISKDHATIAYFVLEFPAKYAVAFFTTWLVQREARFSIPNFE